METSKFVPKHCKPRTASKCTLPVVTLWSLCGHSMGLGRLTHFSWRTSAQFQGSWERKARSAFPTMYLHHFPLSVQDQDSQTCFDCLRRCKGFPPKDSGDSNVAEISLNLAPYMGHTETYMRIQLFSCCTWPPGCRFSNALQTSLSSYDKGISPLGLF